MWNKNKQTWKQNNKQHSPKKHKHTSPWSQRLSCSWPRQCERLSEPGPCEPSPVNAGSPTRWQPLSEPQFVAQASPRRGDGKLMCRVQHLNTQGISTNICILEHFIKCNFKGQELVDLVVVHVLQSVADHADAHVDQIGRSHLEHLLWELLPVFVDFLRVDDFMRTVQSTTVWWRSCLTRLCLTSTVRWAIMARWWPSRVSRAIWAISGSDLPMNIWQAAASICLFWPWIFICTRQSLLYYGTLDIMQIINYYFSLSSLSDELIAQLINWIPFGINRNLSLYPSIYVLITTL